LVTRINELFWIRPRPSPLLKSQPGFLEWLGVRHNRINECLKLLFYQEVLSVVKSSSRSRINSLNDLGDCALHVRNNDALYPQ
jgi:hypothetical protein